jgi:hypothetical protein
MARDACDILDGRGLGESRGEFDGPIMEGREDTESCGE